MTKFENQYINGEWVQGSSSKTLTNVNPYSQETLFTMHSASEEDLDKAYHAAQEAYQDWSTKQPGEIQAVLLKAVSIMKNRKEEIVEWLMKEAGSSRIKAEIETGAATQITQEAASFPFRMSGSILPSEFPGKENRVYRSPKGVIGVIGPWNFPFHLSMRSVAPAIAAGNTVVLKPASDTVVTAGALIADIFEEAGLPKGVLNVTAGRGSEIGDAFVEHPVPRVISFTGSTEVGSHIASLAGKHVKETALELGGNNAFVVLEDADVDQAVSSAIFGKFLHQGQICMSVNRFLIHDSIYDSFVEKFTARVKELAYGDPFDEGTIVGPLIKAEQTERIQEDIKKSVEMGAVLHYGGEAEGTKMQPAVLTEVTQDMPIASEEIFGPAAPLIRFHDEEEALQLANGTPYGLSGAVHSTDIHRASQFARRMETGMVHVNDQTVNDEAHVAFGGEKASGIGRFGGAWALDKFTTEQWVSIQTGKREYPF
ncbi:aldehyde dehydrogenase family protein [Alkalicoccus urumqiensis]|uniref:3-sulfolactaldehyde dehydrogenase n=1 Tax=Alkalicoccus urumqiensis TaxID=1548213 RepID=A0A2P6ML70_ALKUR|nr:aldehyde dehydrogenase family protein [Alkalicoccus urumqiensis]PRO67030.1 aldehyde dehydrogenase [Alkalicoccus urumqiensis]